jgi:hypothetical protein
LIASALPEVAVGDKFLLVFSKLSPDLRLCLLTNLNAFALDYASRQKIGGTSMKILHRASAPGDKSGDLSRTCGLEFQRARM